MKKTFTLLLAVSTLLAACTKSEIAYEQPQEIGFNVVAGNITKAPVDGTTYPTALNMYVNAYVEQTTLPNTPDYINNGEFTYIDTYNNVVSGATESNAVWGGGSSSTTRNPYYWPNEKYLHFSGYSKSGNIGTETAPATASYDPSTDVLTITGYTPGIAAESGANDLMWFPSTKYVQANGYGKDTKYVPVNMYHTCAWITFMVQGDATTGGENSTYKITSLTMNDVDQTADVACTGNSALATTLSTYVKWTNNTDQTGENTTYDVTEYTSGIELKNTYTAATGGAAATQTPKNIETNATTTTGGNIVVIPQKPGTIDLEWTYSSSTGSLITDTATDLSLKLNDGNTLNWEPGKHYVYTITIKANEILIAPTPVDWTDGPSGTVTIE